MNCIQTEIEDVVILEPRVFGDERGYFFEAYSERQFVQNVVKTTFVQDNESKSQRGVLRGLHYQLPPYTQSKLARVISGSVLDIAVDLRKGSPTFGCHVAVELSGENKRQLFVPRGFAHGFVVLSDEAIFTYKCDNVYAPEHDRGIIFNDLKLAIDWPLVEDELIVSEKDRGQPLFEDAEYFDYSINYYEAF